MRHHQHAFVSKRPRAHALGGLTGVTWSLAALALALWGTGKHPADVPLVPHPPPSGRFGEPRPGFDSCPPTPALFPKLADTAELHPHRSSLFLPAAPPPPHKIGFGKLPAWHVQRYLPESSGHVHWLAQGTLVGLSFEAPFSPDSRIVLGTQPIPSCAAPWLWACLRLSRAPGRSPDFNVL